MDYYDNMQSGSYESQPYYGETAAPDFHWNWGAFMYNWIFGFANKAWLCFLCLVPLLNIVWVFVSGAKAEKWAWESGEFENEKTFRATMRSWNRAGLLTFIITIVVLVLYLVMGVSLFAMLRYAGETGTSVFS